MLVALTEKDCQHRFIKEGNDNCQRPLRQLMFYLYRFSEVGKEEKNIRDLCVVAKDVCKTEPIQQQRQ